jgi:hypothetical protein
VAAVERVENRRRESRGDIATAIRLDESQGEVDAGTDSRRGSDRTVLNENWVGFDGQGLVALIQQLA